MKFLNFNKVLCLSPHPDDAEYSMLGSMLKYNDTEYHILCLSKGGNFDNTTDIIRHTETKNAWNLINEINYKLFFSDNKTIQEKNTDEWINYIETNFLSKNKYDAIFLPSQYDSHFEHSYISNLGDALIRISPISIIQWKSPSTLDNWQANMFIDISDYYEKKNKFLKEFHSQLNKIYFNQKLIDGFHINFACYKRNIGYVEQFKIDKLFI